MVALQKLDKSWNNATFDDFFDWRVLLLRQKFAEFGRCIKLSVRIVRKDACDHILCDLGAWFSEYMWGRQNIYLQEHPNYSSPLHHPNPNQ